MSKTSVKSDTSDDDEPKENDTTNKDGIPKKKRESRCFSPVPSVLKPSTSLSSIASFDEYDLEPEWSVGEIRTKISNHLQKRHKELFRACRNFDKNLKGKMTKSKLRQFLRTFVLPLTAAQFDCLIHGFPEDERGKVNYVDFFKSLCDFDGPDMEDYEIDDSLNLDQIEVLMYGKMYPVLHDVARSFWLFDYNKDGQVNKRNLRRILQIYCTILSNEQFFDLWKRYDVKDTGLLKYSSFLKAIGLHYERIAAQTPKYAPKDEPLWEEACTKLKVSENYPDTRKHAILCGFEDPSINGLEIDEVEKFFVRKLSKCGELLKRTLWMFDRQNDGKINVEELSHVLTCFIMPMSPGLFRELFTRMKVDVSPISKVVDIDQFLNDYCQPDPKQRLKEFKDQLEKSGVNSVLNDIKNRVISPAEKIRTAYQGMEKEIRDQMTRRDLKKVIEKDMGFPITAKDFKTIMSFLDPQNTNCVSCGTFLNMFEFTSDVDKGEELSENLGLAPAVSRGIFQDLKGSKLISKMKIFINKNRKSFDNALLACDYRRCKFISIRKVKGLLDNFCFPLTDKQFQEVLTILKNTSDKIWDEGSINYEDSFRIFEKASGEDYKKWKAIIAKLSNYKSSCPKEVPDSEVKEILRDALKSKYQRIFQEFQVLDPCNAGYTYKNDVRVVIARFVFRINNAQFDTLWKSFPLNKYQCLIYEKLFEIYVGKPPPEKTSKSTKPIVPPIEVTPKVEFDVSDILESVSSCSSFSEENASQARREVTIVDSRKTRKPGSSPRVPKEKRGKPPRGDAVLQETVFSTFPHLRQTYKIMRPGIVKNLILIRQHLRRMDPKQTGLINFVRIRKLFECYGIYISEEDNYYILEYFDKSLTGVIRYKDFMRLFVWYD